MHDIRSIRADPAAFDAAMARRGLAPVTPDILARDNERRAVQTRLQELQARRNALAREIGAKKRSGTNSAALEAEATALRSETEALEPQAAALDQAIRQLLEVLPNRLDPDVPDGADESANVVLAQHGDPRDLGFQPKQHFELGEALGMMDFAAAAKLAGTRFTILRGQLARLERALGQFMIDLHTREHGYSEVSVPLLVNDATAYGTDKLPKFGDTMFRTTDGRWLIPTAEVPLTALAMDEIIPEKDLPLRLTALTPCFRSEAGAAGRDTRGMLRQHQFWKVEMVSVTHPDRSEEEQERMTGCAETVLRTLKLPFRRVVLSSGDTGFGAARTFDLEVWLPGQQLWREISSCSNCRDFQARRMNARFRPAEGKSLCLCAHPERLRRRPRACADRGDGKPPAARWLNPGAGSTVALHGRSGADRVGRPPMTAVTREALQLLDQSDRLAPMRESFSLPEGVIYLDGNSLGPPPRGVAARIADVVAREWGTGLIRSWNTAGWIDLAASVAGKIAKLIGAAPDTVSVGDSTSVNLFKLLGAALALRPDRRTIISEASNFPTDLYIAEGITRFLDRCHRLRLSAPEEIVHSIDDDTAVVMLTHVNYRTGAMHDMAALTAAAHARGALALWDLAHSAGAVPVDLTACDADMAVGCGYKYLNGGPGAPAFLYIAPRLLESVRMPITGWLGHAAPFAFEQNYRPAQGIAQATVGTPPILSLAALDAGIDIALQAPMEIVRAKSLHQTKLLARLFAEQCGAGTFRLVTPLEPERRGSQICLAHPDAFAIMQALINHGVIGDFRAPDILRFGIAPLYIRYTDLWDAAAVLRDIMATGAWRAPQYAVRHAVT